MSQNPALEERLDLVDHEARKAAPAPVLSLGRGQERPTVFGEWSVADGLPGWPPYDPDTGDVMAFANTGAAAGPDPLKALLDLWQSVWEPGPAAH